MCCMEAGLLITYTPTQPKPNPQLFTTAHFCLPSPISPLSRRPQSTLLDCTMINFRVDSFRHSKHSSFNRINPYQSPRPFRYPTPPSITDIISSTDPSSITASCGKDLPKLPSRPCEHPLPARPPLEVPMSMCAQTPCLALNLCQVPDFLPCKAM